MRRFILTTFLVLGATLLASCGQKGPLYLPNEPEAVPGSEQQHTEAAAKAESGEQSQ